MKVLLQRCANASVSVGGDVVGSIGRGLLAFVGTTHGDTEAQAVRLAERIAGYRIFPDADGRTNCSVGDVGGAVLVVSQFTLYANTNKGTRPSFTRAGPPDRASALVDRLQARLQELGVPTAAGVFGADMQVQLVNDGPFTVTLEALPA